MISDLPHLAVAVSLIASVGVAGMGGGSSLLHTSTTSSGVNCPGLFIPLGDHCILVDPFVEGTWEESRYFCSGIGSKLVEIDTVVLFEDILNFIKLNGVEAHDYWLGARDIKQEGNFTWESTGKSVPSGSPYWAYSRDSSSYPYVQEPSGGTLDNCLYLDQDRFLFFDDGDCDIIKSPICQVL